MSDSAIVAPLRDGRTISVPLSWSWRLERATPEQSRNYQIFGDGEYVLPLDESVESRPAPDGRLAVAP